MVLGNDGSSASWTSTAAVFDRRRLIKKTSKTISAITIRNATQKSQLFQLKSRNIKELLAEEGFNPLYGARPLKRVIQNRIQDRLADEIIGGTIQEAQKVTITASDGEYILQVDGTSNGVDTDIKKDETVSPDEYTDAHDI